MSRVFEQALEEAETQPFRDYLSRLIENDELAKYEPKVKGICQLYLDRYPEKLSDGQMYWVNKVAEDFAPSLCTICEHPREWQDALDDELLDGLCSSCYHTLSKS